MEPNITAWLPVTVKEAQKRGWQEPDVVFFTGDAYIDHPSFGTAVISRVLESMGLKVVIVPQPNWQDDLRDFIKFGRPRLFFAISAGAMDSMVNHYTANKRRRSDDAYSPGGKSGFRPDYTTITYSRILKTLFPDVPIVIGGIEASLRRLTHYDYWSDSLKPSILSESGADILVYGMGEKAIREIAGALISGADIKNLTKIPQTAVIQNDIPIAKEDMIFLHPHKNCLAKKTLFADNWKQIETESNALTPKTIVQESEHGFVVVNPPYPPLSTSEMDAIWELPFTRLPHPKYKGKGKIPAFDMIQNSINIHRGCFGGCSFCTISAHQGRFIQSRSEASIVSEVEKLRNMEYFHGTITDLGGPSANMYMMVGKNKATCATCRKVSCIYPVICGNLSTDHRPMVELYKTVAAIQGIKHVFIGSGIRYDLFMGTSGQKNHDSGHSVYKRALIKHHVSGRLKVAPEHSSPKVLKLMRKPSWEMFRAFHKEFLTITAKEKPGQQLIPYIISSHPGCTDRDMEDVALQTTEMGYRLEQVQDFTPTPMTCSTVMFYTGINPWSGESVFVPKSIPEKKRQQEYLFRYKTYIASQPAHSKGATAKKNPRKASKSQPPARKGGRKNSR